MPVNNWTTVRAGVSSSPSGVDDSQRAMSTDQTSPAFAARSSVPSAAAVTVATGWIAPSSPSLTRPLTWAVTTSVDPADGLAEPWTTYHPARPADTRWTVQPESWTVPEGM